MDMKPKPPISIKVIITACPKRLQCSAVITVVSPVTQVAEVVVNKASIKGVTSPVRLDMGSINNSAPNKIKLAKPIEINCGVVKS